MTSASVKSSDYSTKEGDPVFPLSEVQRFIKDSMVAIGTPPNHAEELATCLIEADYKGHYCEGLSQLVNYITEIRGEVCNKDAVPEILKESPVTAWVDGHNGLGAVVANFCMKLAIDKAKKSGIGFIVAKGSNSFGIAGFYSLKALEEGLIGMSFTNASPLVAPTRAREGALGTNPISVAAPASDGDSFLLDMATAAVAVGKIETLSRKKEPVPKDWADPETGALRPLGGSEPNSNYKGFGLALLVEILCGILGDAGYGPNIRKYGNFHEVANLGHCFIVINPNNFAPGFEQRLSDLLNFIRNMQPINPTEPVLVPGDVEREHMIMVDEQGGVQYGTHLVNTCRKLAEELDINPLTPSE